MSRVAPLLATLAAIACGVSPSEEAPLAWEQVEDDRIDGAAERSAPVRLQFTAPAGVSEGGSFRFRVTGARSGQNVWVRVGTSLEASGTCLRSLGGACIDLAGLDAWTVKGVSNRRGVFEGVATLPPGFSAGDDLILVAHTTAGTSARVSNFERVHVFSPSSSRLRVVHASPDAPAVDVYANDAYVTTVGYGAVAGYLSLPSGTYIVDLRAAGADPTSPPAYSAPLTLLSDVTYTAVASGLLGSTSPDGAFRILPLVDEFASPVVGSTRVRVLHAGADAPAVGLDVGRDGSEEIVGLARFSDTGAQGVQLPAGTVLPLGVAGVLPFTIPALPPGSEVTVVATGLLGRGDTDLPTSFGLLALPSSGGSVFVAQDPTLYVLHASPDAPPVDLAVGGTVVADDLAFRELAGPLRPAPDNGFFVDVLLSDGVTGFVSVAVPALARGRRYVAVATGLVGGGGPSFQVLPVGEAVPEDLSSATVSVVHASPDAPPVDVGALLPAAGFVKLAGPLAFGESGAVEVAPGSYNLAVSPSPDVAVSFPALSFDEADRWIAVATGLLGDGSFGLTLLDTTASPWTVETVSPVE